MSEFLESLLREADEKKGSYQSNMGESRSIQTVSDEGRIAQLESQDEALALVLKSRLFDPLFYESYYREQIPQGMTGLEHYSVIGIAGELRPNFYFDNISYLEDNPDVRASGQLSILHFITFGDKEGRPPSMLFDPLWYRSRYNLVSTQAALAHYLQYKTTCHFSPLPDFDVEFYVQNRPDIRSAGVDPFEHFAIQGFKEGCNPSACFDVRAYAERYLEGSLEINPLVDHLSSRRAGIVTAVSSTSLRAQPDVISKEEDNSVRGDADLSVGRATLMAPISRSHQLDAIRESGLFDEAYHLLTYPDLNTGKVDPLEHFFDYGWQEDRQPNPYFHPLWYMAKHEIQMSGNPLFHYLSSGEKRGLAPSPGFDAAWYKEAYDLPEGQSPLRHYLTHRLSGEYSPNARFDVRYYLSHSPDVAAAGVDPFLHFLFYGYREGRNPSRDFDVKYYADRYFQGDLSKNPFFHYLEHHNDPEIYGRLPDCAATVSRHLKVFTRPGPDFEDYATDQRSDVSVKLLAFYLPQFHRFDENDEWWGKGFTEWTNIVRGSPRFKGHYQPRVPRDLGFYNLADHCRTLEAQAALAKGSGIYGFVYYYYWFNRRRLMERPINDFLDNQSIDMPFCLMWANENWTRRWDGAESQILISQDYRTQDDIPMIADFARHFQDKRYIRLDGRPLLMVYRPGLIPNASAVVKKWRALFKCLHNEDPILIMAQSFGDINPYVFGLDGAIEFPPHKLTQDLKPVTAELEHLDPDFTGKVYHYEDVVNVSLSELPPNFPLIKTAVPSWDNDARRQGSGLVVTGSSPSKYEAWLSELVERTKERRFFGERLVCINAWNEWCEGAYLEPDLHFGSAYLNATRRALSGLPNLPQSYKVLLVGHDAFPAGAQHLLLNIGKVLTTRFGISVEFLLLDGGSLTKKYSAIATVTLVDAKSLLARLSTLKGRGFDYAILNTTASAKVISAFSEVGIATTALVHELPQIIAEKNLYSCAHQLVAEATHIIFPALSIQTSFLSMLGTDAGENMKILPQGSYHTIQFSFEQRQRLRAELNVGEEDLLIMGAGYADLRKGFDLFLQCWRILQQPGASAIHFCWAGGFDPHLQQWMADEVRFAQMTKRFHYLGYRDDMASIFSAADAFVLSSREDPFPTVVLEALSVGLPVFAFEGAGGIPDLLREHFVGEVVPYADVTALARSIRTVLDEGTTNAQRQERIRLVETGFDFATYVERLLSIVMPSLPAVSVAVPNYNYARYMPDRLSSIFRQTLPVGEIVVLDDCSSDNSGRIVSEVCQEWRREIKWVPNQINSGSVFKQWRKAAEMSKCEYIWIAEADDLASPEFLSKIISTMITDDKIVLGFSDSSSIGSVGEPIWDSYKEYYRSFGVGALSRSEIFEGQYFMLHFLGIKNVLLNVSAVVWRRQALLEAFAKCQNEVMDYRLAGDWRLYIEVLSTPGAKIAYEASPLNIHRRHAQSVTHGLDAKRHLEEIKRCHAAARERLLIPGKVAEKQSSYVSELRKQLLRQRKTTTGRKN